MLSTPDHASVTDLIQELASLGIRLSLEKGQIRITAAKGVLTQELRARMVTHRQNIQRLLEGSVERLPREAARRIEPRPDREREPFPLSDLQLGFYIANDPYMEFHVRPHMYMETDVVDLDIEAYQRAWNATLESHRRELCIVAANAELRLLDGPVDISIRVYDLRERSQDEVECSLASIRAEMERQELPLDRWPWFDLRASRRREQGREVVRIHYNHNNFFIDGFGTMLLLEQIDRCYSSGSPGPTPCEISYRDAVIALNELAESPSGATAQNYWLSRLPDLPAPPALPQRAGFDRRCRSNLLRRSGALRARTWEAFKKMASLRGITPTNALVTAYAYVLATWSNSHHFIISQMATRRMRELHPDMMRMLGNFVSLYPLEIHLQPQLSFAENARLIQERVLQDTRHLQFGGMRVMQALNRMRGSFGSAPSPFVVGSALAVKNWRNADYTTLETSQTVLDHQFFELADGSLSFVWDLMEEFFPDTVVDHMWQGYAGLIEQLALEAPVWDRQRFSLVPEKDLEARRLRNRTAAELSPRLLHDGLRIQTALQPDAPILLWRGGRLSYRELDVWSSSIAAELIRRGVTAGCRIAVLLDRGAALLAAVLGVLEISAAYVPIDPKLPAERIALILRDVGAPVVLVTPENLELLQWPTGISPQPVSRPDSLTGSPSDLRIEVPAQTDLAYVIYTSGSTGIPKGVMIDHRGAINTIEDINQRFGVGPADRILGVSAFTFDLSVYDIFGSLAAGASLVYPEPHSSLDPSHWVDLMIGHDITLWNSVPSLLVLLLECAERRGIKLPSLRLALLSGDKIPLDLPAMLRRVAPQAAAVSLGGATEASIWSIFYPIDAVDPNWATIPYGFPLANQTWHVLDRNGEHCPTWVSGDLYIGGIGLALGYWGDPPKTARAFQFNDLTGERLYRTGDLGRYCADGCIEWQGRSDYQLKIQGHRIDPGEIEAALRAYPGVRDGVVLAHDPGEGRPRRLVGHVAVDSETTFDTAEVEAFLKLRLPAYMVPTQWRTWPQLPLTKNGKIDRKALASFVVVESAAPPREFEAPANDLETTVLSMWRRVLNNERIGVTHDFFELGGQSFDAIRLFALIKDEFGHTYTLHDMWNMRSVRALARSIDRGANARQRQQIVTITAGAVEEALFLVHPAGGSVLGYAALGRVLGRPLHGIQALNDQSVAQQSVPALAEEYVGALRQVRAHGPYALGGWSTGAMIAFEMAAQLERAGEPIAELLLLDGPVPQSHAELDDRQLLTWFIDDLGLGVPLDCLRQESFVGLSDEAQLIRGADLVGLSKRPEFDLPTLLASFRTFRNLVVASTHYQPGMIGCDLTVVQAAEQIVREFSTHPDCERSDWGWGRHTRGRVRCIAAPGNHYTFLSQPLVARWAAALVSQPPASAISNNM